MKAILFSVFILTLALSARGQTPYTNAWIHYDQPYFKLTVSKAGIYRVPLKRLQDAGLSLTSLPPENLRLYHRGEEVAIRVVQAAGGTLSATDYLEFYSAGNTGTQDSLVYRPASARPPTSYSLYSNDTHYFLTVDTKQKGKRMAEVPYQETTLTPEAFHLERQVKEFRDEWSFNNSTGLVPFLQQSYYERGEGWTGRVIQRDSLARHSVSLTNRVPGTSFPIQLQVLVNGRYAGQHNVNFSLGSRAFDRKLFYDFDHQTVQTTVAESDLDAGNTFVLGLRSTVTQPLEQYSLSRYEVRYPQRFDMAGTSAKYFYLAPNSANQSVVALSGLGTSAPTTYDVTDPAAPKRLGTQAANGAWKVPVPQTAQSRTLYVTTAFEEVAAVTKMNFIHYTGSHNYLIITHSALESAAQTYAAYRRSAAGGGYQVLVADMQQLTDQFNFGERGPLGIKHFLDFQLKDGQPDKYLLLIGNGVSFPDVLKTWQDRDFVPTFGYPGSDVLLSAGLGKNNQDTPAFRTGRLSAATGQQVLNYLSKVQEFEAAEAQLTSKNILHLSGGQNRDEIARLKTILENLAPLAQQSFLNARVEAIAKQTTEPVENVNISRQVNEGVGMITFMGHASPTVPDLNIGYASAPGSQLNNKGKYPFMYFNGCGVGNVFYRYETLAADWLFSANKGAIGVLSNSFWSYSSTSGAYLNAFYKALFGDEALLGKPIGTVLQKVGSAIAAANPNAYDLANIHQLILLGDPAVVLFPIHKPDYAVRSQDLFIQSKNPALSIGQTDSLQIGFAVSNAGKVEDNRSLAVQIRKTLANGTVQTTSHSVLAPARQDIFLLSFQKDLSINKIEVVLDPTQQIDELDRNNNRAALAIDWEQIRDFTTYPILARPDRLNPTLEVTIDGKVPKNEAFTTPDPAIQITLRDENPLATLDDALVEVYLQACEGCPFEQVPSGQLAFELVAPNTLQVAYEPQNLPAGTYELLVQGRDASGNSVGVPYRIKFRVAESTSPLTVMVVPNPTSYFAKFVYTATQKPSAGEGTLRIFSPGGLLIKEMAFTPQPGENELYWQVAHPAGMYVYQLTIGEEVVSGKVVVY
ncbi:hypothetical protein GCM10027275_08970 [Rhabdobacter roseus]|uniref:Gingipain domain-containing protein n=1 Tax=Rhabdobacter roseus TaxID=1655419 RepID=A0A840TM01_9BACT|nr:C25 family cysteine peptidase [Rhabdobacter roseus]MBB5282797.1 hypothetical protein [Rhabdobacter roseus]